MSVLFIGIALALIGLVLALAGFGDFRRSREVRRTPTTRIADVTAGSRAEIIGRVTGAAGDPMRIPAIEREASDQEAVYYDLWIAEEVVSAKGKSDTVALASHKASVPFLVDDGSGKLARVSTERAEVNLDTVSAQRFNTLTPALAAFVEAHPTTAKYQGGRVRVALRRLVVGDNVYALGRARMETPEPGAAGYRGDAPERVVFERAENDADDLLVSDMNEAALASDLRSMFHAGVVMMIIGAALGVISRVL